jgi:hypothetical protein
MGAAEDTFYIENTSEAVARADRGAGLALLAGLVLACLAFVPFRLRARAPRAAAWLLGAPALATTVLLQDHGTLLGVLAAVVLSPVMLVGLVLGLVPAPRAARSG